MEILCCNQCGKELDTSMEVEYSRDINELFCSPDCATDRYFDVMQSISVDFTDSEFLMNENFRIINGKLIYVD